MIFCFCGSSKYGIVKKDFLFLREFQIRNRKKSFDFLFLREFQIRNRKKGFSVFAGVPNTES